VSEEPISEEPISEEPYPEYNWDDVINEETEFIPEDHEFTINAQTGVMTGEVELTFETRDAPVEENVHPDFEFHINA
jgi:hypothetical protein